MIFIGIHAKCFSLYEITGEESHAKVQKRSLLHQKEMYKMHLKYELTSWEEKAWWEQAIQKMKTEVLGATDGCKTARKKAMQTGCGEYLVTIISEWKREEEDCRSKPGFMGVLWLWRMAIAGGICVQIIISGRVTLCYSTHCTDWITAAMQHCVLWRKLEYKP